MRLYYSPGACSLASHIALVEGGHDFEKTRVDLGKKVTEDGQDFTAINPRGYVPAIDAEYGLITENPAVLLYIADKNGTMPKGEDYYRLIEWIGFVGTELHGNYPPLFHGGSDEQKAKAREKLEQRYRLAGELMNGKDWLVGNAPGVADNYLFVTTLWADRMDIELPQALKAFRARNREREAVRKAMKAEGIG